MRSLKFSKSRFLLFLFVSALLLVSLLFSTKIEAAINGNAKEVKSGALSEIVDGDLELHFIYVGQGDSTAIRLPDGKTMLIDAGPKKSSSDLTTYLDDVFFEGSDKTIDYFILTHTDEDHTGGAVTILNNYDVKAVYRPNVRSKSETEPADAFEVTTATWDNAVKAMAQADSVITISKDLEIPEYIDSDPAKSYSFTFYGPINPPYSDNNDYSPVMMLENNGKKYMFTGDASEDIEKEFLNTYSSRLADFDVDVLKVGHHGSRTSTCDEFLAAVKPEWAVISCGKDNKYGHPNNEVINRLTNANCQILRTDVSGSVILYSHAGDIKYIADFFTPTTKDIKWWYFVALGIGIMFVICFTGRKIKVASDSNGNVSVSLSGGKTSKSSSKYKKSNSRQK